jgi:hypothetical protein
MSSGGRGYFTTDGQSISMSCIEHPCGTCDQILLPVGMLLSEICGLVSVGRPLWREDGSAVCSIITQWSELRRTRNHTLSWKLGAEENANWSQQSEYEVDVRWLPAWKQLLFVWLWSMKCSHELYKCPINPITNSKLGYWHAVMWQYKQLRGSCFFHVQGRKVYLYAVCRSSSNVSAYSEATISILITVTASALEWLNAEIQDVKT